MLTNNKQTKEMKAVLAVVIVLCVAINGFHNASEFHSYSFREVHLFHKIVKRNIKQGLTKKCNQ